MSVVAPTLRRSATGYASHLGAGTGMIRRLRVSSATRATIPFRRICRVLCVQFGARYSNYITYKVKHRYLLNLVLRAANVIY